ncbi:MAG: GNAT family N-acetyltransferase [Bacillaceae bacterium]
MLIKRDLHDCHALYDLMIHPDVYPFVRQKATSYDEYLFLTKQTMEAEEKGEIISRTIVDQWLNPIGTISLFDVQQNAGFLGTWLGKAYHGLGYNRLAKEAFFHELFYELDINNIFMRIRKVNIRSIKAAQKLPYVELADDLSPALYNQINKEGDFYHLFRITKDLYTMYTLRENPQITSNQHLLEA